MRVNREIRAPKVRLIGKDGSQVGIVSNSEAQALAAGDNLDLVEISPNAKPPVCKITDYGKYRYQQTKKDKESKKAQVQGKLKEVKMKPNIDEHDFMVKLRRAHDFIEKGHKVRVTCMFRGREMAHPEIGRRVVNRFCKELEETAFAEAVPKMMGRNLTMVLAPLGNKRRKTSAENENKKSS